MIKLILLFLIFLLSLLVIFRAPANLLWYVSVLVTEFSWVFVLLVLILLLLFLPAKYPLAEKAVGIVTITLLLLPWWQAGRLAPLMQSALSTTFGQEAILAGTPLSPVKMVTGFAASKHPFQEFVYNNSLNLSFHFYPSAKKGRRPCIVVIHGGSWAGGNNMQLPELNSELAREGYHVASIHYRLAPANRFPAPVEDVHSVIRFLKNNAERLHIDSARLSLLGRSAGGQIALSAAYTLGEPAVKSVINFYGPTDMLWGYQNPTNPLVLDSRKIMENYLGGTPDEVPKQYLLSSATETVTAQSPPTLMIYAGNDPLVSPKHGDKLSVKLKQAGIPHYVLYLPWATHGFDFSLNGPGGQLSTWAVKSFLKATLREQEIQ